MTAIRFFLHVLSVIPDQTAKKGEWKGKESRKSLSPLREEKEGHREGTEPESADETWILENRVGEAGKES